MRFNPVTKEVYTDKGEFVKRMNCPFKIYWDNLKATHPAMRKCSGCNHLIVDTACLSDDELYTMVRNDPETCLKIDLTQHNVTIVSHEFP